MAEDPKFNIKIGTEGDTSGAEDVEKSVKDITLATEKLSDVKNESAQVTEAEVKATSRIIDANVKNTEEIKKQREEFTKWQEERDAARRQNSGGSSLASDPTEFLYQEQAIEGLKNYGIEADAAREMVENLSEAELERAKAAADVANEVSKQSFEQVKAAKAAEEYNAKLEKLEDNSRKLVAVEVAGAASRIADEFRGISPELDQMIGGFTNFIGILSSTGDPVKATIGAIIGEIGNLIKATQEFDAMNEETARRQTEMLEAIRNGRALLAQQIRSENLAKFYDDETAALDRQIAAIERKARVDKAQAEAAAAAAAAGRTFSANSASANGTPVSEEARKVEETFVSLTAKLDGLNKEMQKQEELLAVAEQRAVRAANQASITAKQEGDGSQNALAMAAEAEKLQAAFDEAQQDFDALKQITDATRDKLLSEALVSFEGIRTQVPQALAGEASKVISELENAARQQGGELSATARAALESLRTVMADGVIKPEEIAAVQTAVAQVNSSREAFDNVILSGFQRLTADNISLASRISDILKQLDEGRSIR